MNTQKPKPLEVDIKKPQKVLLVDNRGNALIVERNRQIGFQLRERN